MKVRQIYLALVCCMLVACLGLTPHRAHADSMQIIRDVEIEKTLYDWATPLLEAADINPSTVKIVLVQSDQVNAFVAGGSNIFIYTGLIEKTENPGELIGVMAHEIGHIAGGHLVYNNEALKRASYESILGAALGIGAAVLSGDGKLATAITLGAQQMATTNYLTHSRTNESSADQAALRFLNTSHQSADGLLSFFHKLADQELLPVNKQNEYMRTHPLTENRIDAIERSVDSSPYADTPWPAAWVEAHKRMKAKLIGFIKPNYVPWVYDDRDHSFAANYARTIAAYKSNNIEDSLTRLNALLAQEPNNPYLHELKAQILTDFSRLDEALPELYKTVELAPHAALFNIALAHGLIEKANQDQNKATQKEKLEQAIDALNLARHDEDKNAYLYRLLATAYGRLGDDTQAKLALANEALLQGKQLEARRFARQVLDSAPKGSATAIKAQDIIQYLDIKSN